MKKAGRDKISPSKEIAYIAVMCALLLGGQFALSSISGVEIVTLLLVCFSSVFGARRGVLCAVAFSLLRCFIFGFYPSVILLYLIYYPLLAAVFGGLGKIGKDKFDNCSPILAVAVNVLLLGVAFACVAAYAFDLIKISRLYKAAIDIFLWVIFALFVGLCAGYDILLVSGKKFGNKFGGLLRLISFTGIAAVCTIIFSLIDDVITPLLFGFSPLHTLGYFYASFTAMLPQTVCTVVTVGTMFVPLTELFEKFAK